MARCGETVSNFEDRHLSAMREICKNNVRLGATFVPEKFDGDLLIFAEMQDKRESPANAGRPYVRGRISVHQVASRHERMMKASPLAEMGI
jgi:hypothetical protein